MSQYLNLYLLRKKSSKPIYLTSYCRSADLYAKLTDNITIPYGDLKVEITAKDIEVTIDTIRDEIDRIRSWAENRRKSITNVTDPEMVREILNDADLMTDRCSELQQVITDLGHIHWLIDSCCNDTYTEFIKVLANIN